MFLYLKIDNSGLNLNLEGGKAVPERCQKWKKSKLKYKILGNNFAKI